jgi:hypothetical protein
MFLGGQNFLDLLTLPESSNALRRFRSRPSS